MKTKFKHVVYVFSTYVALSSCVSVQPADVVVEKETLSRYRIENVLVTKDDTTVTVYGNLHSRSRGSASGHVDITFISTNGEVLQTVKTDYHRGSLKARDYNFSVKLPLMLPDGSTVRIVHHRRNHNRNG